LKEAVEGNLFVYGVRMKKAEAWLIVWQGLRRTQRDQAFRSAF
jgi:hypothetical protein